MEAIATLTATNVTMIATRTTVTITKTTMQARILLRPFCHNDFRSYEKMKKNNLQDPRSPPLL